MLSVIVYDRHCTSLYQLQQRRNISKLGKAQVRITLVGLTPLGREFLQLFHEGMYIGKLLAADDRRRVRDPEYLSRMFGRSDRFGRPLLSLGGMQGSSDLILEKIDGRTVAFLRLQEGLLTYEETIHGFLSTLSRALSDAKYPLREHRYQSFARSLMLPAAVVADKAQADMKNGILTLTLPKAEEAKPKTISVKAK